MTVTFKDHFSGHAKEYQKFRPTYPDEMFEYLAALAPQTETAWDCATGNGQAATSLAGFFTQVIATDASDKQLDNCRAVSNVHYYVANAEHSMIPDKSVDLITVAQALHWFDTNAFFQEAGRVLKPQGVIAIWCYKLFTISPEIDAIVNTLYYDIVGPYWPEERKLIENDYADLPFPFPVLASPSFNMSAQWNFEMMCGYLSTWSAVQKYMNILSSDPIALIDRQLREAWGDSDFIRQVNWQLTPKIGINI
ncbi:class I SAM-dependent methyltransferase [Kaarinaea lacus]